MLGRLLLNIRPLYARDVNEKYRAATPLELFFDLVSVIALAAVASGFHHAMAEGHTLEGLLFFSMAFLAVWWPWNMFTWFASAYDNDDPLYRLLIMVMMVGMMIVAADVREFFEGQEFVHIFSGYLVMRIALILLWIRVGIHNPKQRKTAVRYSCAQILVQGYWAFMVFGIESGTTLAYTLFFLGFAIELFVPWWSEYNEAITWHRHHIIERFGLLNIIVLGEILLGAVELLKATFDQSMDLHLLYLSACGMVIAFSMWWLYFAEESHIERSEMRYTFLWTYGHILIFAGGIATGAALSASTEIHFEVMADGVRQASDAVRWAVCLSIATYVFGVWFVRDRFMCSKGQTWILITIAGLIACAPLLAAGPFLPPALLALAVFLRQIGRQRKASTKP